MSGIRPRWPEAASSLSILPFLEVLDAVLICMAPVGRPASQTPSGVSPRPATPRIGRKSPYSAVPRGIQVFGYIPAAFEALYGRSRDLSPCSPSPACAPRLNRTDAVVGLVGVSDLSVSPSKMDKIPQ